MERFWQWAWDRHASVYSSVMMTVLTVMSLPIWLLWSWLILAVEGSRHYVQAVAVTVVIECLVTYAGMRPGRRRFRLAEQWASGREIDRVEALEASYALARRPSVNAARAGATVVGFAALSVASAAIAGAGASQLVKYAILGTATGFSLFMIVVHSWAEGALRPVRLALAGNTAIGDSLPRSRPTFGTWSSISLVAAIFAFSVYGAMLAAALNRGHETPVLVLAIGCGLTLGFGVPITLGAAFSPSLRPIRDLAEGTERVAAGDYSQRLPVVQDDDLGALAASFNRMQAGLAERRRLHAAFGTYVDPALAARLLEQGDDVFTGERREVTVMFIDIRDFTPFAEANTAEDTVARLNALFEIVVPAVVEAGGHVNKFLGDGALAVFGAPNDLPDHADAALRAAVKIHRLVDERFGAELRIGIGINTGVVIAGTIGGGGKLEFTLIGDTVNVAARVEQLTKTTSDTILLTRPCVDALAARPTGLLDRGSHALKGKSAPVQVFSLDHL
jgi:adenylate cyclase